MPGVSMLAVTARGVDVNIPAERARVLEKAVGGVLWRTERLDLAVRLLVEHLARREAIELLVGETAVRRFLEVVVGAVRERLVVRREAAAAASRCTRRRTRRITVPPAQPVAARRPR